MEQKRSPGIGQDAVIVVRLPQELRDGLREQAVREDRTVASLIRVAARAYLQAAALRSGPPADVRNRQSGRAVE